MILLSAPACDNVEWGGVDVRLQPPPPVEVMAVSDSATAEAVEVEPDLPPLPVGPVLYMGSRSGSRVSIRPVAEISGDSLIPIVSDRDAPGYSAHLARSLMGPGATFTLFSKGVRVGTVRADTLFTEPGFCSPAPVAEGVAEMISGAGSASRFVAIPSDATEGVAYGTWRSPDHTYEQRVASINLASAAISANSAIWPESVLETRADMQGVPLDGDSDGAMAATFLYRDRLAVEAPEAASSYSIFVLGTGGPIDYEPAFTWYHPVSDGGKAAPRLWDTADWDGDGEVEILLQVFGENARWSAALDRRAGRWTRIFEESCGTGTGTP